MKRRIVSMRMRVAAWLAVGLVLTWSLFLAFTLYKVSHEAEELIDGDLVASVRLGLQTLADHAEGQPLGDPIALPMHDYEPAIALQAWSREGVLRARLGPQTLMPAPTTEGFSDERDGAKRWRAYAAQRPDSGLWVRAMVATDSRAEITMDVLGVMLWPIVVIVPFAVALVMFFAARALRPLAAFSEKLTRMSPDSLERVATPGVSELQPLASALNSLIARLRASREHERAFVADAAHELRTPLASIRLWADVAAAEPQPEKVRDVVKQIAEGADRASHLVNQLLALAGLEAADALEMRQFDIAEAVRDALSLALPLADARGVNLAMDGAALVTMKGHEAAIAILLGNLLRNAVAHAPRGTTVTVNVLNDGDGVEIAVTDEGLGVPVAERARIFERFVRLPGQAGVGTGLGLSIVARVAELHRGSVAVENTATGGARFVVRLPLGVQTG